MYDDDNIAEKIIEREHELLGEKHKPGKKERRVHGVLKREFGNGMDNIMDYDFTKDFSKIINRKNRG